MPGFVLPDYCHSTLLQGTAALNCNAGIIGGSAGVARDTLFLGYYIDLGAGPATLTVTGLRDSSNAAQPWVITGQVAIDQYLFFVYPILNEFAAFTFQPSVAAKVWVFTRAYTGG